MNYDSISVNGKIMEKIPANGLSSMLASNFIYQKMHMVEHEIPQLAAHLDILKGSLHTLYFRKPDSDISRIKNDIHRLVVANRIPRGSHCIALYVFACNRPDIPTVEYLVCEKPLLYKGYSVWHEGVTAITAPYEYPFAHHKTAVSLTAHYYAQQFAEYKNARQILCTDYNGMVISAGENPIFAVSGNRIITPSLDSGVAQSVERMLILASCVDAGIRICEENILEKELKSYDEIFTVNVQGILSISSYEGHNYTLSMARHLGKFISKYNHHPL